MDRRPWIWLVLAGCGADASAGATTPRPSASATSSAQPPLIPTFDCSLDVCPSTEAIATFRVDDHEVALYNASRIGPTESLPMVAIGRNRVVALDLTTTPDETHTLGWAMASILPDQRTIIGLIDGAVESTGDAIVVAVSRDGGTSFRIQSRLPKPHYLAEVRELVVRDRDQWTITLNLFDCADCGVATGKYVASTTDGGKTFTAFVRRGDATPAPSPAPTR